jgi:hypothetical protein
VEVWWSASMRSRSRPYLAVIALRYYLGLKHYHVATEIEYGYTFPL